MSKKEEDLPVKEIKSLIKNVVGDDFEIIKKDWKYLTDPGENFGSLIFAIKLEIMKNNKNEILHIVAKLPPPSLYLIKLFNSPFSFKKELVFYRDLTPAFIQLQIDNGIKNPEDSWIGPKYYGGRCGLVDDVFDTQASIVLENLNYSGFKMIDRLTGLTKLQTEYAVKKLAKLHALAIAMREQKPKIFNNLVLPALENVANEHAKECLMDMIKKSVMDLGNINEAKPYMDKVQWTIDNAPKIEEKMVHDKKWYTFVHNDFWVNNMMFKFGNNDEILDMKIIDFQLGFYDYGVKDLIFFLMSSPNWEITGDIFDEMINIYYNEFIMLLKTFNVYTQDYTHEKFLQLVDQCGPSKLAQCLMMTQVIKSIPGSAPKIETIENKESFLKIGGGQIYHDKLIQLLYIFKKRNWLLSK
ncbi:uncharacterized protein LOC122858132 [Aphidius gifuensis]|uniref:uncharacterized protein LOC122858132 n=1 Tax=Aphidius gifuensis TaxID=684658 RepID=UPI001CDB4FC1|nr:uncharacterized protein LOC122858132 [Aphidius gifuensis]